jgi:hypothetical protein
LSSYHSSVVKVLAQGGGFYTRHRRLSRFFAAHRFPVFGEKGPTPPVDFHRRSASASHCDILVGWASRVSRFDRSAFAMDRFLHREFHFTTSQSLVKGSLQPFFRRVSCSFLTGSYPDTEFLCPAWKLLSYYGFAFQRNRSGFLQRAGLYRERVKCQGYW